MKAIILSAWLVLASFSAQADIWQTGGVQPKGELSLGGHTQVYFDPGEFMIFGQATYGLSPQLQLELRLGGGTVGFYGGAFGKYYLFGKGDTHFSVWGGFHGLKQGFFDFAPILSHEFQSAWTLYGSTLLSLPLGSGSAGLGLVPGVRFGWKKNTSIYAEFVIKIAGLYNAGSIGVRYFLSP
jgi:hypothetical protein